MEMAEIKLTIGRRALLALALVLVALLARPQSALAQTLPPYDASAGMLNIGKDPERPDAEILHVAYTLKGADPATRPVTFVFDGGPGAASIYLHLAGSAVEHAPANAASRLAAVEAWIDAHLEEPITLGRLCEIAGVRERALQKAFELRRGLSPMRFVVERRLAAARRLLESAGPGDGVTGVATRLGFHLGRFAGLYREVFGEAPSQTLARARR
jgi:AraC-like DNA-binding protein